MYNMDFFLQFSFFTAALFYSASCSKLYINHSPKTISFTPYEDIRLSEVGDVIPGSLGFTVLSTWPGLNVKSAFGYPEGFVLVNVKTKEYDGALNGLSYNVKEESSVSAIYAFLQSKLNAQSERLLNFKYIVMSEEDSKMDSELSFNSLNAAASEDLDFIRQMEMLPAIVDKIKKSDSVEYNGQDIVFVEIDAFKPLLEKYGKQSDQVKEADIMMNKFISKLEKALRKLYEDRVVLATVFTDDSHSVTKREATFTDKVEMLDVNLAEAYSEDFPVIFNICLFLGLALALAILATSASMAYMDPGHDSIIYRMTNPRMKKD